MQFPLSEIREKRGYVLVMTLLFIAILLGLAMPFILQTQRSLQSSKIYSSRILSYYLNQRVFLKQIAAAQELIRKNSLVIPNGSQILYSPRTSQTVDPFTPANDVDGTVDTQMQEGFHTTSDNSLHQRKIGNLNAQDSVFGTSPLDRENWWQFFSKERSKRLIEIGKIKVYNLGGTMNANLIGDPSQGAAGSGSTSTLNLKSNSDITPMEYSSFESIGVIPSIQTQICQWLGIERDATMRRQRMNGNASVFGNTFLSRSDLNRYFRAKLGIEEGVQYWSHIKKSQNIPCGFVSSASETKPHFMLTRSRDTTLTIYGDLNQTSTKQVKSGEQILRKRFPLEKLGWLENPDTRLKSIYADFGLTRNSDGTWAYNHGKADGILTFKEIDSLGRDPDFFEILKATIGDGSIGKYIGDPTFYQSPDYYLLQQGSNFRTGDLDLNKDLHILRIGVNLIDQYDIDNDPTEVQFTLLGRSIKLFGTEDLPYINRIYTIPYRSVSRDLTLATYGAWFAFELWNPHQTNKTALISSKIRISGEGTSNVIAKHAVNPGPLGWQGPTTWSIGTAPIVHSSAAYVEINTNSSLLSANYREPELVDVQNVSSTANDGLMKINDGGANHLVGLFAGEIELTDYHITNGALDREVYGLHVERSNQTALNFVLSYQDKNGIFKPYQIMPSYDNGFDIENNSGHRTVSYQMNFWKGDPRSSRFGAGMILDRGAGVMAAYLSPNISMRGSASSSDFGGAVLFGSNTYENTLPWGWFNNGVAPMWGQKNWYLAMLSDNKSSPLSTYYTDPDGVNRWGDAVFGAYPYVNGNLVDRPLILNRPFRSVGEIGYAYRDLPWKTLDFFTNHSADANLLEAFCIDDLEIRNDQSNIVDLDQKCLESFLTSRTYEANLVRQALRGNATSLATSIKNYITSNGVRNRAEYVKWAENRPADTIFPAPKTAREFAVRALAENTETRTVHLMFDISSAYLPSQVKDFRALTQALGNRRIWYTVFIDRYTGKVIGGDQEQVD